MSSPTSTNLLRLLFLFGLLLLASRISAAPRSRPELERDWRRQGRVLVQIAYRIAEGDATRSLTFGPQTVAEQPLYLRAPDGDDYVCIGSDGRIIATGKAPERLQQKAEILLTPDGLALFVDGRAVGAERRDWQLYWLSEQARRPRLESRSTRLVRWRDGFMRTKLLDDQWRVTTGQWELQQRGGGMPETEAEAHDYNVQRAVNPFSVLGSGHGLLTYGDSDWPHVRSEASFYLGHPRLEKVIDANTVPTDTDMLLVYGDAGGRQVAFGWYGQAGTFCLLRRDRDGAWDQLWASRDQRPPLTNWVRLGCELRFGHEVVGYIDGREVVRHQEPRRLRGQFHVGSGAATMEFDDAAAWSLPAPAKPRDAPIHVQSRQFAAKKLKGHADPEQFEQWARGSDAWIDRHEALPDGGERHEILSRVPLWGDFRYASQPEHPDVGSLPQGRYEFRFYDMSGKDSQTSAAATGEPLAVVSATCGEQGWVLARADGQQAEPVFTLRFRRRAADGHHVQFQAADGSWQNVAAQAFAGPLRLGVARVGRDAYYAVTPKPEHHQLRSANLRHEFFESAPTAWRWLEGSFRMDARWACQDRWNFMACGSTGVPYMTSIARYHGDQQHDYFMSLRPVYPWDSGHADFTYDPRGDSGWEIFRQHHGWYNRRDLNFAFCTDGRNPLSGYAVVYAGYDNSETLLLRRGKVVARTSSSLIDKDDNHHVIHWRWWRFTAGKFGDRITVYLNGELLFDYRDPEPLSGGHVGFWSIRNGFTVSRVTSSAARLDRDPTVLNVPVQPLPDSRWRPVRRDSLALSVGDADRIRARLNGGSGFHALRWEPQTPVDLTQQPVLRLPLRLPSEIKVNLHLDIGGQSYVYQLTGPLTRSYCYLTPSFEQREELFQLPLIGESDYRQRLLGRADPARIERGEDLVLDLGALLAALPGDAPAKPELRALTIGNTSNEMYLLAGATGNAAGATYEVGAPEFVSATAAQDLAAGPHRPEGIAGKKPNPTDAAHPQP